MNSWTAPHRDGGLKRKRKRKRKQFGHVIGAQAGLTDEDGATLQELQQRYQQKHHAVMHREREVARREREVDQRLVEVKQRAEKASQQLEQARPLLQQLQAAASGLPGVHRLDHSCREGGAAVWLARVKCSLEQAYLQLQACAVKHTANVNRELVQPAARVLEEALASLPVLPAQGCTPGSAEGADLQGSQEDSQVSSPCCDQPLRCPSDGNAQLRRPSPDVVSPQRDAQPAAEEPLSDGHSTDEPAKLNTMQSAAPADAQGTAQGSEKQADLPSSDAGFVPAAADQADGTDANLQHSLASDRSHSLAADAPAPPPPPQSSAQPADASVLPAPPSVPPSPVHERPASLPADSIQPSADVLSAFREGVPAKRRLGVALKPKVPQPKQTARAGATAATMQGSDAMGRGMSQPARMGRGRGRGRLSSTRASTVAPSGRNKPAAGAALDAVVQQLRANATAPAEQPQADSPTSAAEVGPPVTHAGPAAPRRAAASQRKGNTQERRKRGPPPAVYAAAVDALQDDAPQLLEVLQGTDILERLQLLSPCLSEDADGHHLSQLKTILDQLFPAPKHGPKRGLAEFTDGGEAGERLVSTLGNSQNLQGRYCLHALRHLVDVANHTDPEHPEPWGWCRELQSFIFVFERANRIVWEKPEYGHATYFFELEQPLSVTDQVRRLIRVLSVKGVRCGSLLEASSEALIEQLTADDRQVLQSCGWIVGSGISGLLNFAGERIYHRHDPRSSSEVFTEFKKRIGKALQQGTAGGRIVK